MRTINYTNYTVFLAFCQHPDGFLPFRLPYGEGLKSPEQVTGWQIQDAAQTVRDQVRRDPPVLALP